MSDKFVQPIAQSNYELVPLPGAFITDGRFVRYEDDKNISDTVKDFDGKIETASEAAEEASDKADALDVRVTALENKPSGDDYSPLKNKPKINGVELNGNKTASDLGLGTYSKPSGGIPKTDLANAVQTSLGKADTALQEHQDISGKIDAPQTAAVGQVLAVKAVDASGKPTEWEVVENGGSAGGVVCLLSISSIPYDFVNGSAVVLNDDIYMIGTSSSGYTSRFYRFDGTKFYLLTSVPYSFYKGAAVVYNNEIHILGGDGGRSSHYKWDGTSWSKVSTLPYSFYNGSAVVYKGKIQLLGGDGDRSSHYEWDGTSWSKVSTLPYIFTQGSAVVYNDEIHLLGGYYNSSTYTAHYKWGGTSWSKVSTLSHFFIQSSAVVANGKIHILGSGSSDGYRLHEGWNGISWERYDELTSPFYNGNAVVIGKSIFLIGGASNSKNFLIVTQDKNENYITSAVNYIQFV